MSRLMMLGALAFAGFVCFGLAALIAGEKRERTGLWMVVLTIPVALGTLWLAAAPGGVGAAMPGGSMLLVFVLMPVSLIGLIAGFVLVLRWARAGRKPRRPSAFGLTVPRMAVWVAILVATYGLVRLGIPQRVGFGVSRSAFEALVPKAEEREWGGAPVEGWVGIYRVEAFARDPRGGVYFRVNHEAVFIDTWSYGFAWKPNEEGTPFGNAGYRTWDLGDGWYGFTASNDY